MIANSRALLAEEALRRGLTVEITAHGDSMRPLLFDGDRLTVEPAGPDALAVDDVALVVRDDGRLVAHRVVSIAPLRLRGDACLGFDDPVLDEAVLGRVTRVARGSWSFALDDAPLYSRACRVLAIGLRRWEWARDRLAARRFRRPLRASSPRR